MSDTVFDSPFSIGGPDDNSRNNPFDFGDSDSSATPSAPIVGSLLVSKEELEAAVRAEPKQKAVGDRYTTAVSKPDFISAGDFTLVVSAVYHEYTGKKRLPTVIEINKLTGVGTSLIKKTLETEQFKDAVTARGIPWDNFSGLTATQMLVAQIITNPTDRRDLKAKLKSAGVTYAQYRAWMSQPPFSQYMSRITEGMLTDHIPDFNTVLTKKALAGDLNSIKYINEMSGRHDPNRQQVLDLQATVATLLDIIQRNVKDPVAMQAIAQEFKTAMSNKNDVIKGELG